MGLRQKKFARAALLRRVQRERRRVRFCLLLSADLLLELYIAAKLLRAKRDLKKLRIRRRAVRETYFNVNIFSTEEALRLFRFRPVDIPRVVRVIDFEGVTDSRGYRCHPLTATCIMMRRLAYPCRWYDIELLFGMPSQTLSEVFWCITKRFRETCGVLTESLRPDLLVPRARMYADCIREKGAPLPNCIGFIDATKIMMTRPGGEVPTRDHVIAGTRGRTALSISPSPLQMDLYSSCTAPKLGVAMT